MDSARSAATDSAFLALLLRLGHAAPTLSVMSVHHFGVVAATVQRREVNVLAGSLICTVFSPVSFFVVCLACLKSSSMTIFHIGCGLTFLPLFALDRRTSCVLGFGSAVSAVPNELGGGHHPLDQLHIVDSCLCLDWPYTPLLQLVCGGPGTLCLRDSLLDLCAFPEHVVPVALPSTEGTCGWERLGVQQSAVSFSCGRSQAGW